MAQAPATPKLTRARRLLAAVTGLPQPGAALPSERAALALRHARAPERWAAPREVVFAIPLVGPGAVGDWEQVCALLNRTLESFRRQSVATWRAVICCQTRPPLPEDARITHLPFDDPTPGNDKWRKLAALSDHLSARADVPALVMTFDADDLAAPMLVETLLRHPRGALLTHGHVFDAGHERLALARPQSLRQPGAKAFWKLCGSCAALPVDPAQGSAGAQWAFLREMSQHEHRMIPYLAALAGGPLDRIDEPLALYLLNHGENFGARRGRVSFKTRFVQRFALRDMAEIAAQRARYGL